MSRQNYDYLLTIEAIGNGRVVSTSNQGYQKNGGLVTLKAIANVDARFIRWQGDVTGSHHVCNLRINGPCRVVAVFTSNQLTPGTEIMTKPQSLISSLTLMAKKAFTEPKRLAIQPVGMIKEDVIIDLPNNLVWMERIFGDIKYIDIYTKERAALKINGWRLPTIKELKTIIQSKENSCVKIIKGYYWSCEVEDAGQFSGWVKIISSKASLGYGNLSNDTNYVLFVRPVEFFHLTTEVSGDGSGIVSRNFLPAIEELKSKNKFSIIKIIELKAIPAKNSLFKQWHGDLEGIHNPCVVTVDADKTITAEFDLINYALRLKTSGSGAGSIHPSIEADRYPHGTVLSLTASAGVGSKFKQWGGDAQGTSAETTITIDGTKLVTAEFVQFYPLSVSTIGQGQGSVQRSVQADSYEMGSTVILTAVPASGHSFIRWCGDATGTDPCCTLRMDGSKSISAQFEPNTHSLTVKKIGLGIGTVHPNIHADRYLHGTLLSLTATAEADSRFKQWTGDAQGTNPEIFLVMANSKSVTAEFIRMCPLSVSITGEGLVRRNIDADAYVIGSTVDLTALPAKNYLFVRWQGDGAGFTSHCSLHMDGPKAITAHFAPITHHLTLETRGSGMGSIHPSIDADKHPHGTELSLTATAAAGSRFKQWSGDVQGTSSDTRITIDSNKSVTAEFGRIYPLHTATSGQGKGSVQRSVQADAYDVGSVVELTAIPAEGHLFMGWQGDASGKTATCKIHMDAAKTVTAEFVPKPSFDVTVVCVGTGSGTVLPASQTHWQGSAVDLLAKAEVGSVFDGWEGDVSGFDPRCRVTVNANLAITARFSRVDIADTDVSVAFDGVTSSTSADGMAGTVLLFTMANRSERQIQIDLPLAGYVTLQGEEVAQHSWVKGMIDGEQGATLRAGTFRKLGLAFDQHGLPKLQAGEHLHLTLRQSKPALLQHMSFRCIDSVSREFALVALSVEKVAEAPAEEASEEPAATAWTSRMQQMEQEMQEALSKLNAAAAAIAAAPPPPPPAPLPAPLPATTLPVASQTLLEVLAWLCTQNQVPVALLRQKLLPLDLMPSAVIDDINERAFDVAGEAALDEAEDAVTVQRGVLLQVLAAW